MKINFYGKASEQVFKGFGASGAWWAQEVGKWESRTDEMLTKDKIAELLYNKDKGIGLEIYRYNIGGGSQESGRGIYWDNLRRAEDFYDESGNYDFSKDAAAVYMMKKCVSEGAGEVIFFVNSPDERFTKNGLAHTSKNRPFTTNLNFKQLDNFVKYVLDVTAYFKNKGVPIKYISPINEPVWIWNGGQEGCHYSPFQGYRVLKRFVDKINNYPELKGVKFSGFENGDIRWFNKQFTLALVVNKKIRAMVDSVDVHSYFTDLKVPVINNRIAFLKRFRKFVDIICPDLEIKMSEWTHMTGGRDKGMNSALVTANTIADDINILGVTSWQHWLACSPYDYCDGLIYIYPETQTFEMTKRYYVTGNFSKFIKTGSTRVKTMIDDSDINSVAFDNGDDITVVLINNSDTSKEVSDKKIKNAYLTDSDNDLTELTINDSKVCISPRSVTTIIYAK